MGLVEVLKLPSSYLLSLIMRNDEIKRRADIG